MFILKIKKNIKMENQNYTKIEEDEDETTSCCFLIFEFILCLK